MLGKLSSLSDNYDKSIKPKQQQKNFLLLCYSAIWRTFRCTLYLILYFMYICKILLKILHFCVNEKKISKNYFYKSIKEWFLDHIYLQCSGVVYLQTDWAATYCVYISVAFRYACAWIVLRLHCFAFDLRSFAFAFAFSIYSESAKFHIIDNFALLSGNIFCAPLYLISFFLTKTLRLLNKIEHKFKKYDSLKLAFFIPVCAR